MTLAEDNNINIGNIAKVASVEVKLTAELGRTKISLKDAVEFDSGSIVMLDRATNEPIDIYLNEVLIAKGKIVAIEDTYGIKIVEIVDNNKTENE